VCWVCTAYDLRFLLECRLFDFPVDLCVGSAALSSCLRNQAWRCTINNQKIFVIAETIDNSYLHAAITVVLLFQLYITSSCPCRSTQDVVIFKRRTVWSSSRRPSASRCCVSSGTTWYLSSTYFYWPDRTDKSQSVGILSSASLGTTNHHGMHQHTCVCGM